MKITCTNSINFGYDKKYHKKLQEQLESKKSPIAQQLQKMDEFALGVEDEIVKIEKEGKTDKPKYLQLADLLVDVREVFSQRITDVYPDLNYCRNELKTYCKEDRNKKNNDEMRLWREYMINTLAIPIKPKKEIPPVAQKTTQQNPQIKEVQKAVPKILKSALPSDLLTLYEPNEFSPKGFQDVASMDELKTRLQEEVIEYVKNPELEKQDYEEYGIRAPRGYLLYGPPGCGKTFITSAVAAESDIPMYKMDLSKVGSKYVNQTSNNIQLAFDTLKQKAKEAPNGKVLLFMDEVDALAIERNNADSSGENEKTTATLLKNIEQARDNGIIVFAATNRFDSLDEAFKARFDGQFYIGLPNEETIKSLVEKELSKKQKGQTLASNDEEISELSKMFMGHSNRSIVFILDEAGKIAKKDNRSDINFNHVKEAIEKSDLEKPDESKYISENKKAKSTIGFAVLA